MKLTKLICPKLQLSNYHCSIVNCYQTTAATLKQEKRHVTAIQSRRKTSHVLVAAVLPSIDMKYSNETGTNRLGKIVRKAF